MNYNKLTPKMALNLAAPHTWVASICPAIFGCLYSWIYGYNLPFWQAICLVAACVFMQSSVNSLNDYIDYVKGTDCAENNLERSDAVLIYENINPKSAVVLSIVFMCCGVGLGIMLIIASKCLIPLWIGIIGVLAIVFYSCGKTPISYMPIGELVSGFVMGGLIPLGCVAVASGEFHPAVIICAIPFIISIALIMMSNNGCDIEKDIEAGRKTLPTVLGRKKTRKLYTILMYIWVAALFILPILEMGPLGMLCAVLVIFIAKKNVLWLMDSPLDQENRVEQMKKIVAANKYVNGCYLATLFVQLLINLYFQYKSTL